MAVGPCQISLFPATRSVAAAHNAQLATPVFNRDAKRSALSDQPPEAQQYA